MKLYKLDAFYSALDFGCPLTRISPDECYFESLDLALAHLSKCCHLGLPWSVSLYHGFLFDRMIARGAYD